MNKENEPQAGEYWWFQYVPTDKPAVGLVDNSCGRLVVYETGDENGLPVESIYRFISKIPVPHVAIAKVKFYPPLSPRGIKGEGVWPLPFLLLMLTPTKKLLAKS